MPRLEGVEGRQRVVIEGIEPVVDCGRFPVKRTIGEKVRVRADVFTDGHDSISCVLLFRLEGNDWRQVSLSPLGNDRWEGEFTVESIGRYEYTIEGWVDPFLTWQRDLKKRVEAKQDISTDLVIGARMVGEAADRASGDDVRHLRAWQSSLLNNPETIRNWDQASIDDLVELVGQYPDKRFASRREPPLQVTVDRPKARFSSWYEMFPRSTSPEPGRHGTFRDCIARLPYIAEMGFDVLYLPPIHPIGRAFRKGRNNAVTATPSDPGSPWGIGGPEGGHCAIHPELGTLEDFQQLRQAAEERGIELALDIAFQCSPDHPYVQQHPEWFRHRPDGTIQYAENPPKKYQDIYPFDFESSNWRGLWEELTQVMLYWVEQGVRIFRVDNPHTKPFPFWEYSIGEVKRRHPDVIFLSEAFTRPKIMYRLAKLGFTQSYTYFTWRNAKHEFIEYFTELTQTNVREFFRPNLWPNTPDILPEHLQVGGRPAFMARLVLAATLAGNYGIYGPAFELGEHVPREPGSEEYLNSEKYEIRHWDLDRPDSLRGFIARVNRARRDHPALQSDRGLRFHEVNNERLLCYTKQTADRTSLVLVVVNLDFRNAQSGWIELPMEELGLARDRAYLVHDVLGDTTFRWEGARNYVELDPSRAPAHLFRVEQPTG